MADNGQYPSDQVKDLPQVPSDLERCNVPALGEAVENVPENPVLNGGSK